MKWKYKATNNVLQNSPKMLPYAEASGIVEADTKEEATEKANIKIAEQEKRGFSSTSHKSKIRIYPTLKLISIKILNYN